jgi:ketosteroid isomerase-like protein
MTSFTPHTRDLIQVLSGYRKLILMLIALSLGTATNDLNASPEDVKTVAALDTKYQAAVKSNDAATMDQILADDFVLVTGRGKVSSKADLIESARKKEVTYERQDEEPGTQKVRVWRDTAVVTALLWIKAEQGGKPVDYKLWFSDTYVRTPAGWRYVFGQASLPLPQAESK